MTTLSWKLEVRCISFDVKRLVEIRPAEHALFSNELFDLAKCIRLLLPPVLGKVVAGDSSDAGEWVHDMCTVKPKVLVDIDNR
jgi:hypothetical protein